MAKRQLVLEDGSVFVGESFGSDQTVRGEVVFNTSMTGYQEVISNPAYDHQIVMFTYPLIGNYGINWNDFERVTPLINGVIVKEVCHHPTNFRVNESLHDFLKAHDIPGIAEIDTRKLMRILRRKDTMKGSITTLEQSVSEVIKLLQERNDDLNEVQINV